MGVVTEPLSKLFQKEQEKNKIERLRTEGFEDPKNDNYPERFATEESKDTYDPLKRKQQPLKKAEIIKGKGLAPPPGWNAITSTEKNGHNPDYIDLLSGSDEKENNVQSSNEVLRTASSTPSLSQQPTTLLDDLLSTDLTGNSNKMASHNGNNVVIQNQSGPTNFNFSKNNHNIATVSVSQSNK